MNTMPTKLRFFLIHKAEQVNVFTTPFIQHQST